MEWSIHKDTKKLDRPGRAKAEKFWYLSHTTMRDTIGFEMHCNNFMRVLGSLWSRHGCIPMGGSFLAQAANLHSLWEVYSNGHLFRQLGALHIFESGFPFWETPHGIITLCQFRDNILVASTYKDSPSTPIIQTVCNILRSSWNQHVLCDCMSNPGDPCLHACHKRATMALGYALVCHHSGMGVAYLQPIALDSASNLKLGPPLLSPPLVYPAYLAGIVTGALSNARYWCHTWAGEMLSLGAWLQIALLSGYKKKQVARAAHPTVTRALATSPNTPPRKQCGSCTPSSLTSLCLMLSPNVLRRLDTSLGTLGGGQVQQLVSPAFPVSEWDFKTLVL